MPTADLNDELYRRMTRLGLREEDIEEIFTRGTGAGGQKMNKTSSTVQLKHLPSGTEVRCQKGRQQSANRYWARMELCDKIEKAKADARLEAKNEREKVRRQNRPRPRGVKEKILKTKRERSGVKSKRGRVRGDD
jgi:protein subunit release factor B